MASKESMVTAPFMILVYDRIFVFGTFKEAWRRRWPLYVLAGRDVGRAGGLDMVRVPGSVPPDFRRASARGPIS